MLFNRTNNGQEELKALLGFLHASSSFANIKTDIMLAEEDMIELIGKPVYDLANNYYNQPDRDELPVIPLEEGGYSVGKLVEYIQLPIAYYATGNYSAHTDVSHSGNGRKVIVDGENEKMAWEWMINRDDEATLNKAHKTTDRLIAFLEENADDIEEWKESDAQKTARSLFINSAKIFDQIFPIDNSRRFFIKIIPFIKEVERKHLLPVLGKTRFDDMKAAILSGDFTDEEEMLQLIRVPLVYHTLSLASKRLSVRMLPNGIFQDYISESQTAKARKVAPTDVRKEISNSLRADADLELENLQKEITKLDAIAASEEYTPESPISHIDSEKPILRL